MVEKYGFYTAKYEAASVEVLMTGDGRTQFTDIKNTDGTMSLGIGYGDITKSINEKVTHPEGTLLSDIAVKWEIRFENPASVDSMIETLQRVKAGLICRHEFEDINQWKIWFDTGKKEELTDAIGIMERVVALTGQDSDHARIRKPYLEYAFNKMNERFPDWLEEAIPF